MKETAASLTDGKREITGLRIGIAFDLRPDLMETGRLHPDDRFEEYDSVETVESIASALAALGHEPRLLGGGRQLVDELRAQPPELVFNMAEGTGTRSREAHVPAVCEMLGVPYTHSDPTTLCLTLDKSLAKAVVAHAGVATPAAVVLEAKPDSFDLRFPVIAKPIAEGSSIGITDSSKIECFEDLRAEVGRLLAGYGQRVIVEEFCTGPEFTVGVVGTGRSATAMGTMEIVPRNVKAADFVYSVSVKRLSDAAVEYTAPPARPASLVEAVERLAVDAYRVLGCQDVGRVDVRLDGDGRPQFLEVNPLPGLKPGWSDLVLLSERIGMSHNALIGRIVDEARSRCRL